jgi:chromosome segregation ATPase
MDDTIAIATPTLLAVVSYFAKKYFDGIDKKIDSVYISLGELKENFKSNSDDIFNLRVLIRELDKTTGDAAKTSSMVSKEISGLSVKLVERTERAEKKVEDQHKALGKIVLIVKDIKTEVEKLSTHRIK